MTPALVCCEEWDRARWGEPYELRTPRERGWILVSCCYLGYCWPPGCHTSGCRWWRAWLGSWLN